MDRETRPHGLEFYVFDSWTQLGEGNSILVFSLGSPNPVASTTAQTKEPPKPPLNPVQLPMPGIPRPLGPPTALVSSSTWWFPREAIVSCS
jgi:hypothetical protein